MAPSSRFRRPLGAHGTPAACKTPKPPIPPPVPPPWPPDDFNLHYVADWEAPPGPVHVDVIMPMQRQGGGWLWAADFEVNGDFYGASWHVDTDTHLALLQLTASKDGSDCHSNKADIPVTWNTPTAYNIAAWDDFHPIDLIASADFFF